MPGWNHAEKVDFCKGYWNLRSKVGVATHFSKIISILNLDKKKKRIFVHRIPWNFRLHTEKLTPF